MPKQKNEFLEMFEDFFPEDLTPGHVIRTKRRIKECSKKDFKKARPLLRRYAEFECQE